MNLPPSHPLRAMGARAVARLSIFAIVAVAAAEAASNAQEPSYLTGLLHGECRRLVVAGREVQGCNGRVMNTNYRSGRSGFTFGTDLVVVTFSGMDTPARGDSAYTQLDKVIFTRIGSMSPTPRDIRATGRCLYSNPNNAGRYFIRCSARTGAGEFNADFVSDGQPLERL